MTKTKLVSAQINARQFFEAVEKNNLIIAGKPEQQLTLAVSDLVFEKFRISNHWHKLVRSNSLFLLRLFK